jgi:hypothetical protein
VNSKAKLQLDIRFKKNTIRSDGFLLNKCIHENQLEFTYFHGEDCYEECNIFTFKNQYQFTSNEVDEYRYELFARIFVNNNDFGTLIGLCIPGSVYRKRWFCWLLSKRG